MPDRFRVCSLLVTVGIQAVLCAFMPMLTRAVSASDSLLDMPMPTYKPREDHAPRARIGGGSRATQHDAPFLVALVPDHIGFTIKQDPSLCWYLSTDASRPLTITMIDSRGIRPILEQQLADAPRTGINCIRLGDYGLSLREYEQYRWYVTLVLDENRPSLDIVAGGMIERIPFEEACMLDMPCSWTSCELEAVYRYADSGLWYDAIACLVNLIERDPGKAFLKRMLDHLLRQSGVELPS